MGVWAFTAQSAKLDSKLAIIWRMLRFDLTTPNYSSLWMRGSRMSFSDFWMVDGRGGWAYHFAGWVDGELVDVMPPFGRAFRWMVG